MSSKIQAKKSRFFRLSSSEYAQYQQERERPRGAFADIWEPSTDSVSLHRVRVDRCAVRRVERTEKPELASDEGLFLTQP